MFRRYIRLDFVSVTKSEITVEFKWRAMLLSSLHSETYYVLNGLNKGHKRTIERESCLCVKIID